MNYEVIELNNNAIELKKEFADKYKTLLTYKNELTKIEEQFKEEILNAMEEHSIDSFENEFIKVKYVPKTTKTIVDAQKVKDLGLFEECSKTSNVKASVRITIK